MYTNGYLRQRRNLRTVVGIVRLALRRPYTFIVMGLLIAVLGIVSLVTMPTDIFPDINIPVVSVVWTYCQRSVKTGQE
jgi:multidrug efflux pump subunit AcrB